MGGMPGNMEFGERKVISDVQGHVIFLRLKC